MRRQIWWGMGGIVLTLLLACQKNNQSDPYNFAFISIDSQEDGNVHPLLDSLDLSTQQLNQDPLYRGDLLQYTNSWSVGLRHLLNRGNYDLILPINLSPDGSTPQQVSDLFFLIKRYPEQNFAIPLDLYNDFTHPPANLSRYVIFMHEVAFLSGVIAASLSEKKRIALVAENLQNRVDIYSTAFIQGVRTTSPEAWIKMVLFKPNHQFSSDRLSVRQKSVATSIYQDGFDIIFEITDHSLPGILQAAVEQEGFVITHHLNHRAHQGRIMAQLIERIDLSSTRLIETLSLPQSKQQTFYGNLATGDAQLSWAPDPDPQFLAQLDPKRTVQIPAIKQELQRWRKLIINQNYRVHNSLTDGPASEELEPNVLIRINE